MNPILSIAIPTYNRSVYAIKCISSLLSIKGELEIVVSDSSSDVKLFNLLNNEYSHLLLDKRLKYYFTKDKLDMTSNLNRAIEKCNGHYVVFLGDDDTLVPEVLLYLKEFKELNIPLISPDVVVNYAWPDFSTKYFKNGHKSNLYIDHSISYIKKIKTSNAFEDSLSNCFQGTNGLPKLYHGFVSRELLYKIKEKTGNFLHGSTPDMSAAIGLCFVSDYFIKCNFPMTIPGASGMSNTGRAANNKHVGKLEDENQTSNISESKWIKGIPRYFSVEIVWAQAGLETANHFSKDVINRFPFVKFISLCIVNHPTLIYYNLKSIKELIQNNQNIYLSLIPIHIINYMFKKIFNFYKRILNPTASNGRYCIKNISDINEAQISYFNNNDKKLNLNVDNNLKMIKNINVI